MGWISKSVLEPVKEQNMLSNILKDFAGIPKTLGYKLKK